MTTRKKKRQQEGGGFLKKVSSLFNLDTVNFLYFFIIYFLVQFIFNSLTGATDDSKT